MTAGLRYTRNNGRVDGQSYRDMAKNLQSIIEDELDRAGKDGRDEAQHKLAISGTGKSWTKGPWGEGGTGNRIETGEMYDALDYRIVRGESVGLDVGWPRIWKDYFGIQDRGFDSTGFRNPSSNDAVAGMGIIAHLRTYMRDSVDQSLDRATRRIVNGL